MKIFNIVVLLLLSQNIFAGGGVSAGVEYENLAADNITSANSATSLINESKTIENEVRQLQLESQNTGRVSDYQWSDISGLVQRLSQTMREGQALSYSSSNIDSSFKQKYPDYTQSGYGNTDYSAAYAKWNGTTLDTLSNSLQAAGLSAQDFRNEQSTLKTLQEQGRTATGRMQVLQISTEIASESVNQLQELKQLTATQASAQNAYMAYKVSKDTYHENAQHNLIESLDSDYPPYDARHGFTIFSSSGN